MIIDVDASGPIFDGRASAAAARICREAEDAIAAQAYAEVAGNLNRSIRNPTPYYETQIRNERITTGRKVHDSGIVYGPWLEGTSSRNRTTRFKGYASFRRAKQAIQGQAASLVRHVIARHVRSM